MKIDTVVWLIAIVCAIYLIKTLMAYPYPMHILLNLGAIFISGTTVLYGVEYLLDFDLITGDI